MNKNIVLSTLILILPLACAAKTTLPLPSIDVTHTTTSIATPATTKPTYNWNYWSYEFGFGLGYLHLRNQALTQVQSTPTSTTTRYAAKSYGSPWPDFRIGIEKSWRLGNHFTATIDFSCLTPAITLGYLASARTRVYIGAQYSILLNHWVFSLTKVKSKTYDMNSDGIIDQFITHQSLVGQVKTINPLSILTPRFGIDHFLSSKTMLRLNLSYDWRTFERNAVDSKLNGSMHWPQLTISIKRFF